MSDDNLITLRGSTDIVCDFFNCAVNNVIYMRGIYPPETFKRVNKYGLSMMVCYIDFSLLIIFVALSISWFWLINKKNCIFLDNDWWTVDSIHWQHIKTIECMVINRQSKKANFNCKVSWNKWNSREMDILMRKHRENYCTKYGWGSIEEIHERYRRRN